MGDGRWEGIGAHVVQVVEASLGHSTTLINWCKMLRIFSIIGDSNIKRHMNLKNCHDQPLMSRCEVIPPGKLSLLAEALNGGDLHVHRVLQDQFPEGI